MDCKYVTARRTTPEGWRQHQCSLIVQVTGITTAWVSDDPAVDCSGDDGTNSACAQTINDLLALRVRIWQHPDSASGCAGCLNLDQAFALILSRQGTQAAEEALLAAVKSGMPQAQAEALAAGHGMQLDGITG